MRKTAVILLLVLFVIWFLKNHANMSMLENTHSLFVIYRFTDRCFPLFNEVCVQRDCTCVC